MAVRRYRTEILIPEDRTVVLHLPPHLPEGRASVVVVIEDEPPEWAEQEHDEREMDHLDMEWWEEFNGETEGESRPG
jgi:hypothetical protein